MKMQINGVFYYEFLCILHILYDYAKYGCEHLVSHEFWVIHACLIMLHFNYCTHSCILYNYGLLCEAYLVDILEIWSLTTII